MSIGRRTRAPDGQFWNRAPRLSSLSRYDLVLALLPLVVVAPALASGLLGVALHTAMAGGSLLGIVVLADALFLNPPREGGPTN